MKPLIFLSFLGASALAQAPHQEEFDALDRVSHTRELPCPETAPAAADLFVIFDGTKGFCPRLARSDLPLWNQERSLRQLAHEELTPAERGHFEQLRLDEITMLHGCYFIHPVAETLPTLRHKGPFLYYSKGGAREATRCVKELNSKARVAGRTFRLTVLGYSLGAAAALQTARDALAAGIPVETLMTVDPVANGAGLLEATMSDGDSSSFFRPAGLGNWINFYQKLDRTSLSKGLFFRLGIRGSRVRGADFEQELFPPRRGRLAEHSTIVWEPAVLESLRQRFQK